MRAKICNKCGAIITSSIYSHLTKNVYSPAGQEISCESDIDLCKKCHNELQTWLTTIDQNQSSTEITKDKNKESLINQGLIKTVGELKKVLENLDDNLPLASKSSNFELKGSITPGITVEISKFKLENKKITDQFDYSIFYSQVCVEDANGIDYLQID